jgi:hypothetical protein
MDRLRLAVADSMALHRTCLICGRQPSEPHHLRFAQRRAFGRKVSDEYTVPLCRLHHRELHRSRNEPLWWKTARIDPIKIARELWDANRPRTEPQGEVDGAGPSPNTESALPVSADNKEDAELRRTARQRPAAMTSLRQIETECPEGSGRRFRRRSDSPMRMRLDQLLRLQATRLFPGVIRQNG